MKDFSSVLFSQLNSSDDFEKFIADFNRIKDNIERDHNIDELFEMLHRNKMARVLRNKVEKIIESYIRSLLADMDLEDIDISPSYDSCSIDFEFKKVPSFEYKPHHWGQPSHLLVDIDFAKRQIEVFDSKDDYKKADELLRKKIEREKQELEKLKNKLELMKQKRKSRAFVLKEIRENILFLNVRKYILFYIGCYFFPSKYKLLLEIADNMIKNLEEEIQNQEKRIRNLEGINYMDFYKKLCGLQKEILERLEPLDFEIVTVQLKPGFDESD